MSNVHRKKRTVLNRMTIINDSMIPYSHSFVQSPVSKCENSDCSILHLLYSIVLNTVRC